MIYISDVRGRIIRLQTDSFRNSIVRDDKEDLQTMGFLAMDDNNLFFSELGKRKLLKIDKETK